MVRTANESYNMKAPNGRKRVCKFFCK